MADEQAACLYWRNSLTFSRQITVLLANLLSD